MLQDLDGQFVGLTVAEDIAFSLENDCVEQEVMKEKVDHVSRLVNINDFLHHSPQELSGGQKQRVSLAGTIVNDVKILLFDEPLANLDPKTGKSAIELIDDITNKTKATTIIIEHRLEDVLWKKVDRIILVDEGTVLADLTPNDLLSSNILIDHGIREPLYITCMKYAGVQVTKEMNPEHINSLVLDEQTKDKIKNWYTNTKVEKKENGNVNVLEVKDLYFSYMSNEEVLHGINLTIKQGEMLSIVGQNGAGKSTLAKLICGFEKCKKRKI